MNSFDFPVKVEDKTLYLSFVSFIGSNNAIFCVNSRRLCFPILIHVTCLMNPSLDHACEAE